MMKRGFIFSGRIRISAIGAYTENFLTELIKSGIRSSGITNQNGIVYFYIRRTDYIKVARIAKTHNVKVRVQEKNKSGFFNFKISKYSGLISGIIFVSVGIIISQKFIWKINVHGNEVLSDSLIIKSIAENGIFLGAYSDNINTDTAEYAVKLKLKEISWINIEANGSRVDVFINEGENVPKPEISKKTPCNIIASKDGVIVETEIYSGTLMYNIGGGVSKGSIIVSGIVNDGADNLLMTHANAKIIAEFTETVKLRQDFKTIEKKLNNSKELEKELMLMGFVIPITKKIENTENKICEEYTEKLNLAGLSLPAIIKTNTYTEYEEVEITRTIDDVNRILQQKLEIYCQNFFSEYEILDIKRNLEYDEKGITLTADIKLKGNIAVQQEIMRRN